MQPRILMTGGSGHLGTELQRCLPGVFAPETSTLDITQEAQVQRIIAEHAPALVLHLAAYTDVQGAESNRARCWQVNVCGTRHVVWAAQNTGARLVHISTDYVFAGDRGMYREEDPVGPPVNYYALSKLAAEEVARVARGCLVIRTSFRPRQWPYATAFTDVYTSQDYVDVIAPLLADVIRHVDHIEGDLLHVGTERKSVYDLARRRAPHVQPASCAAAGVPYPRDISMDVSRFEHLRREWAHQTGASEQGEPWGPRSKGSPSAGT